MTDLTLGFGLAFTDLYENAGLEKLDRRFITWLGETDGDLTGRLLEARAQPDRVAASAGGESGLLTALAPTHYAQLVIIYLRQTRQKIYGPHTI